MKRTAIKRKAPLKRVSTKRAKENRQYLKLARAHLELFPYCQCCLLLGAHKAKPATQCHHAMGRGKYYLDTTSFRSACDPCHHYIHHVSPNHARSVGLLPPR